ncbi:MAG TPA: hypothetical protein VNL71_10135 [Chloroflexota bacterium]|nr:hypothetical protein [Chloroflexota bacterium]
MIDLSLLPSRIQARAGGQGRAMLTMRNPTSEARGYQLEARGIPDGWYTLTSTRFAIPAKAVAQAALTVYPPASAGTSTQSFTLVVTSIDDPTDSAQVEAVLEVEIGSAPPAEPTAGNRRWVGIMAGLGFILGLAAIAAAVALHGGGHHAATPACPTVRAGRSCGHPATPTFPPTARPTPRPTTVTPSPTAVRLALAFRSNLPGSPMRPPGRFRLHHRGVAIPPGQGAVHATVHPTAAIGTATDTPTPESPTASPTPSVTVTPTSSPTATATSTDTGTATDSATATETAPATDTLSPTDTSTATASPSASPTGTPTATPTNEPTATVTLTPSITPTPGELGIRFGYRLTATHFILNWSTTNAGSFQIDGLAMPTRGARTYPLSTHTFVLEATSTDGSQTKIAVAALSVLPGCRAQVNLVTMVLPGAACRSSATPSRTTTMTPTPTVTASPTPRASTTPSPSATTASGTSTPAVSPVPGVTRTPR